MKYYIVYITHDFVNILELTNTDILFDNDILKKNYNNGYLFNIENFSFNKIPSNYFSLLNDNNLVTIFTSYNEFIIFLKENNFKFGAIPIKSYLENLDNNYATETRKARRKGKGGTQEFFTPESLVNQMCDKISQDIWEDPNKDFLEPCFGNGNFLVEIIRRKLNYTDWETVLNHVWGVELMADNVEECKERILTLLNLSEEDSIKARQILDEHLVCSDFFKWDFENWKAIE